MHTSTSTRRAVAVLVALFVGLGGIGAATGMVLGGVGAASSAHEGGGHRHDGGVRPAPPAQH
jgi:hypothetical protein